MAFANSQYVNIDRSVFYDIRGNIYNGPSAPGEQGIYELFKASCPDAFHDSQARDPPPRCLQGTRVGILKEIFSWIAAGSERILWMSGPAGVGKSAIAQTIAEACASNSTLASAFFFYHAAAGRNTAERLIASIAYQLVMRMTHKRSRIGEIVEKDLSIFYQPYRAQIQALIIPLFTPSPSDVTDAIDPPSHLPMPSLIIIDGLDECQGDNNQRDVVEIIGELVNTAGVPLSCIIISRPEPQIEESLGHLAYAVRHISLGSWDRISQANNDIYKYLRHHFNEIYRDHNLVTEQFWPTDGTISKLVEKSGGMFIYASTVVKYVNDRDSHPMDRLDEVLDHSPGTTPFLELDHIYRCILGAHKNTERLLSVLTIVCSGRDTYFWSTRLGADDIDILLQLREGTARVVLRRLHSILDIDYMSFYHKSFRDFIHNKNRAQEYFIDTRKGRAFLAQMLLRSIRPNAKHGELFSYATCYWMRHCRNTGRWDENPQLLDEISKALDAYDHLGSNDLTRDPMGLGEFLGWLEVQPLGCNYHPRDIQYRLFRKFWEKMKFKSTVNIFTFYEEIDPKVFLPGRFVDREYSFPPFSHYHPYGLIPTDRPPRRWISYENRKSSSENRIHISHVDLDFHDAVDPLIRRLLQEPGSLEEYNINIVDGHIEMVDRCLEMFSINDVWTPWPSETRIYAQKYWAKHLSHVPPGNSRILDSLRRFSHSQLQRIFGEDSAAALAWLKSSGIKLVESETWLNGPGIDGKPS